MRRTGNPRGTMQGPQAIATAPEKRRRRLRAPLPQGPEPHPIPPRDSSRKRSSSRAGRPSHAGSHARRRPTASTSSKEASIPMAMKSKHRTGSPSMASSPVAAVSAPRIPSTSRTGCWRSTPFWPAVSSRGRPRQCCQPPRSSTWMRCEKRPLPMQASCACSAAPTRRARSHPRALLMGSVLPEVIQSREQRAEPPTALRPGRGTHAAANSCYTPTSW